ncbi:MAG TPA: hypothetical protein VEZ14_04730 [Dehalococcoidia bacterium]|nr:hypothetical protein [Dehalococcoidia bacterium]
MDESADVLKVDEVSIVQIFATGGHTAVDEDCRTFLCGHEVLTIGRGKVERPTVLWRMRRDAVVRIFTVPVPTHGVRDGGLPR